MSTKRTDGSRGKAAHRKVARARKPRGTAGQTERSKPRGKGGGAGRGPAKRKRTLARSAKKRPAKRRAARPSRKKSVDKVIAPVRKWFDSLPEEPDDAASLLLLVAAEPSGGKWAMRTSSIGMAGGGVRNLAAQARGLSTPARRRRLARLLEALASPHRVAILCKLLEGPATYQALQKATGLKVGPLYHHVNQLRMAGLVAPKERDLYRISRAGRTMLLGLFACLPMLKDARPAPSAAGN